MKQLICCLLALTFVAAGSAQENPFKKGSRGDWAKYLVTTKNETEPLMSAKDQPRWWVISDATDEFVRVDAYLLFGERRVSGGGNLYYFKERFEPVGGIAKSTKIQIVSTSKEKMTIAGKQYECTKIVRKIDQPLDESTVQMSWIGTSTLWICDAIPLGLAKMENVFQQKLTKSDSGQKIAETWVLAECGFKNWKEK